MGTAGEGSPGGHRTATARRLHRGRRLVTACLTVPVLGAAGLLAVAAPAGATSPPAVTGVSPDFGPVAGGTSITISGSGFTGATAVEFGSRPAASFIVDTDDEITAVAPEATPGVVDVSVTTTTGTSATGPADRYTFQGQWKAYVTSFNISTGSVVLIDTATGTPGPAVSVGAGTAPDAVAHHP